MLSDGPKKRLEKTWEELVSAASIETAPKSSQRCWKRFLLLSKSANEPCPCHRIHLASASVQQGHDDPTQIIKSDTGAKALLTKTDGMRMPVSGGMR